MTAESPPEAPEEARPPGDRRAWLRLVGMLAVGLTGLGTVVGLSRAEPAPPRRAFDRRAVARVRHRRPDFVLVGNSMVGTRFDERVLNRALSPRTALVMAKGGTYSAGWFLMVKNYVAAARVRPRRVLVFFRRTELTDPRLQTQGRLRARIEPMLTDDEPVLEAKLRPASLIGRLEWWLRRLAPTERLTPPPVAEASGVLASHAVNATLDESARKDAINALFEMNALRTATVAQDTPVEDDWDFAGSVADSFLPDLIAMTKAIGSSLAIVRVRTRADADGVKEAPQVTAYMRALAAYLKENGVEYADLSGAEWEHSLLYGSGDHIAPRFRAVYTRRFVQNLPQLFR